MKLGFFIRVLATSVCTGPAGKRMAYFVAPDPILLARHLHSNTLGGCKNLFRHVAQHHWHRWHSHGSACVFHGDVMIGGGGHVEGVSLRGPGHGTDDICMGPVGRQEGLVVRVMVNEEFVAGVIVAAG